MKIAVAQLGARMHYAVPEILENNNLLSKFYTDIYSKSLIKSLGNQFSSSLFAKLNSRRTYLLNDSKVVHYPIMGLNYKFETSRIKNLQEKYGVYNKYNSKFAKKVANDINWKETDAVYVFNSASKEIIIKAKEKGKKVILEQCIAPFAIEQQIVSLEYDKFPKWNNSSINEYLDCSEFKYFKEREIEELNLADIVLCPSVFVYESVCKFITDRSKLKIVPYGFSSNNNIPSIERKDYESKILKILTVGAGLRKGTQYILEAAKILEGKAKFTLLGELGTNNLEIQKEISDIIDFRGHIPRNEVHKFYENSDLFLLPSLCEGSATATYEAYSYGLPVIATANSGALITNNLDGLVINESTSSSIVEAVNYIINNRKLEDFSRFAKLKAIECSKEAYSERLLSAISLLD